MIMLRNGRYTSQLFNCTDNLMHGKLTMVITITLTTLVPTTKIFPW